MTKQKKQNYQPGRRLRVLGLAVLVLLALVGTLSLPTAQPAQAVETTSELLVVIWPTPSVQVARGDILSYQIQVKNFNRSGQSNIRVYIPYDAQQLTIIGAEFEHPDDWISELSPQHVLVTFPTIDGGRSRTATLYARVANDLPDGTVISTWPSYSWNDSRAERYPRSSNAVPILVGATNVNSDVLWMAAEPASGPPGTVFNFFSDRFLPIETVQAFLVVPEVGPIEQDSKTEADRRGRVWLDFASDDLAPGTYQLEVRGLLSNLRASATFVVE